MAMPRRRAPASRWLAVAVAALLAAGCAPQSVTEEGRAIHNLYNLFLYIAAVVFVVVSGLVIWSVLRYRRRGDELPSQTHGNNRLELAWTLIPTVIVLVLFGFTLQAQNRALDRSGRRQPDRDRLPVELALHLRGHRGRGPGQRRDHPRAGRAGRPDHPGQAGLGRRGPLLLRATDAV